MSRLWCCPWSCQEHPGPWALLHQVAVAGAGEGVLCGKLMEWVEQHLRRARLGAGRQAELWWRPCSSLGENGGKVGLGTCPGPRGIQEGGPQR